MASVSSSVIGPAAQPFSMRSILAPLIAIIMGTFMVILDTTAVNVALPTLVKEFNTKLQSVQWVLTGYMLAQAAVIPLAGWLSDRFGAKRIFLTAVALFTIGSALCATAQSSGMLITFRVLQGLGGGFVMPIALAYIYRLSPPDKRGIVMGTLGIPVLFAPALGPSLSGLLVEYASWRWIFLINVPIGALALLIGNRGLPAVARQAVVGLDLPGMLLGPLAFASLSYGVSEGATSWTSTNTLGGLIVGGLALLAFAVVELRAAQPLLELRVFRSRDFSLAIVAQWISAIGLFGGIFLIPLFLQQVRGYGAFDTGLTLMAQALTAAVFMPIGGRLFDRIGIRPLAVAGFTLLSVSTFLLTRISVTTQGVDLILPLAMRGAGMGLMMMPLNTHILNSAPRNLVSRVTSLTQALQNVVASLAIAGLSTIVASRAATHIAAASHTGAQGAVRQAALTSAFSDGLLPVLGIALAGLVLAFALRRSPAAQTAEAPRPASEASRLAEEGPRTMEMALG